MKIQNIDTLSIILMASIDALVLLGLLIYYKITFSWESLRQTEDVATQVFAGWRDEIKVRQKDGDISDFQQSLLKQDDFGEETLRQPQDDDLSRRNAIPELSISVIPTHMSNANIGTVTARGFVQSAFLNSQLQTSNISGKFPNCLLTIPICLSRP